MINNKEIQNVSALNAFDRYKYFIKKIADAGEIWILKNDADELALSKVEKHILLSIWSAKEFTQSCLTGEWENYKPQNLSLDEFEIKLVPVIIAKEYLIDIFPVNNKAGFVVGLNEFIKDLNVELEKYE